MKLNKEIGFIGCGNMGCAVLRGILKHRLVSARKISFYELDPQKARRLQKTFHVRRTRSIRELANNSKILILAVKPQQLKEVARDLRPYLKRWHVVISILAGTTLKTLKKYCGSRPATVRVMPNLGALVGEAMSVVCGQKSHALQVAKRIFGACGDVLVLKESYFDLVTAVSGSGPALFFHSLTY